MNSAAVGLCIDRVHVWRGDRHVLKGICLELRPRELLHVAGPNGAGKTTLLRVATGLLKPEQGSVAWHGEPIAQVQSEYQSALAYASHETALKGDLTALENLCFMVSLKRRAPPSELRECLERTGVAVCADLPVRVLSAGQRRRVVMARILAARAVLWLLDEPFTNLDAAGSALMSSLLEEHVNGGGMALVVAHQDLKLQATQRRMELKG
ncbi:MAG: cytochrome c biogenesis heme-transporting ATPase CcmA [Steroidobacteraceae bacterium]